MTTTLPNAATTDTLRVAIVGEVDHGKSTLLGRILLDSGAITPDRLTTDIASGGLAFLLDALHEEQKDMFTLDTAQAVLETASRRFVLIDVPGHAELLRNMVTGASRAAIGAVVVDVTQRTQRQTRRHLRILELLGVSTCVCVVTKMDLAGYAQDQFDAVTGEIAELARNCGITLAAAVPVSSIEGVNVIEPAPGLLPWYHGEPLIEVLSRIGAADSAGARLRFAVQAVIGEGAGRRVLGRVESGVLEEGRRLTHSAGSCVVERISRFGEPPLPNAVAGDSVGLTVSGDAPQAGDVLAPTDAAPTRSGRWLARLLCTSDAGIDAGARILVRHCSTGLPGRVGAIRARVDSATLDAVPDKRDAATRIGFSEFADVVIELDDPAYADDIRTCAPTGRFMLCDDDGNALAVGVIEGFESTADREVIS